MMKKAVPALLILACVYPCFAKYSGGSGQPNDPYQIANVNDLLALSANTGDYDEYFVLTADIDLDPNLPGRQVFTTAVIAYDLNNANIFFDGTPFEGTFDGAGHKISNLTIDTNEIGDDYLGLFGSIYNGEIKNLGLEKISITGGDSSILIGGLAGHKYHGPSINNCYSTGVVEAGNNSGYIGGLVGIQYRSAINNCYSTCDINGGIDSNHIGGLVGYNDEGDINNCFAKGNVNGGQYSSVLSGLVGTNSSYINNCFATGNVKGGQYSSYLSGLVGINTRTRSFIGFISNCCSAGDVTGGDNSVHLGGLVGSNYGGIMNCFSKGSVTGGDYSEDIGGLVGVNGSASTWASIQKCYSTGSVFGDDAVGGLVGRDYDYSINDCYFLDIAGPNNGYGTPLTDEEMKQKSSFISWDFNDVWAICETTNYPKLIWQILTGDIVCPDGVDTFDLARLCGQWLVEEIPADSAPPPAGDGIVDFADFSIFANQWGTSNGIDELLDFTGQWLKTGLQICSADISPMPEGDRRVNFDDLAVMANAWLEGF